MGLLQDITNAIKGRRRNTFHVSHHLKGDKRLPHETFKQYQARRRHEARLVKEYLKGDMLWCSKAYKQTRSLDSGDIIVGVSADRQGLVFTVVDQAISRGTYRKEEHGIIQSFREAA